MLGQDSFPQDVGVRRTVVRYQATSTGIVTSLIVGVRDKSILGSQLVHSARNEWSTSYKTLNIAVLSAGLTSITVVTAVSLPCRGGLDAAELLVTLRSVKC